MSLASVQSRISAIQDMINALNNNGRPPVSVTENGAAKSTSKNSETTGDFSTKLASQISAANKATPTRTSGKGQIQGAPGTAEAFVEKVRSYIGVPYVWGGTDPAKGLDCSGLVQTAAREVGVTLPRVTYDQQHSGVEVDGIENAKPGDLLITRNSGHVAVYVGNGKAIHAPRPGKTVTEANVSDLGPIVTIRRVMPSAGDAPGAPVSTVNAPTAPDTAKAASRVTPSVEDSDKSAAPNGVTANAAFRDSGGAVEPSPDAVAAGLVSLLGALGNAALAQNNAASGPANRSAANPGNPSADLAAALVGALSGAGAGTAGANPLTALMATANSNNSYSSTLLSQFLGGSSLYGSNAAGGLGALAGNRGTMGANASLSNTASSLSALGALRSSLGV
ncbi:C40 family peptidase [Mobiluncus sp.]|uniref:C40 family peptidase n=1 Tax=Mobiluncus sp. TaxID=47293 RepID=UPI002A908C6E|nr:C40 family peptidase [Mobiluncus sp.]MDY6077274.1 C40 family peptidase [Mobiluncus sp.]